MATEDSSNAWSMLSNVAMFDSNDALQWYWQGSSNF